MRARCLILGGIILASTGRAHAEVGPSEEARRAFSAGVILLKDPDGAKYEEALSQFNRAYRLSGSWKVLGNIGLCGLKLERDGEAIAAYEKYLAHGAKEIDIEERAQVERDLAALKAQVVQIHVEFPIGASRLTDERTSAHGARLVNEYPLTSTSIDLGLHPGQHVITLRFASDVAKWEVKLDPATTVAHRFEPVQAATRPATSESHGARTAGFVTGGVGVVGLAVGTYFGLKTFSKKSESDPYCTGTLCDPEGLRLRNEAKTASAISNVAFAAGLAGVAVGTYLVFFSGSAGTKAGSGLAIGSSLVAGRPTLELQGAW
ncbi:MAG TPA: hypothetical protein VF881_09040 [Polyangiaceae bacterium]